MSAERAALPGFLAGFSYRGFRLLWTGAFLSSIGTWTQDVALSWLIHTRFHDPFYLGLRSFAQEAPLLTFMLLGGAVVDVHIGGGKRRQQHLWREQRRQAIRSKSIEEQKGTEQ